MTTDNCTITVSWSNTDHTCDGDEQYIVYWICDNDSGSENVSCAEPLSAQISRIPHPDNCQITVAFENCAGIGPLSDPETPPNEGNVQITISIPLFPCFHF